MVKFTTKKWPFAFTFRSFYRDHLKKKVVQTTSRRQCHGQKKKVVQRPFAFAFRSCLCQSISLHRTESNPLAPSRWTQPTWQEAQPRSRRILASRSCTNCCRWIIPENSKKNSNKSNWYHGNNYRSKSIKYLLSHKNKNKKQRHIQIYTCKERERERERGRVDLGGEGGNHSTDIEEDRERCVKGWFERMRWSRTLSSEGGVEEMRELLIWEVLRVVTSFLSREWYFRCRVKFLFGRVFLYKFQPSV